MSSFFRKLFGFEELSYFETRAKLAQMIRVEADPLAPAGAKGWQRVFFDVPGATSPVAAGTFRFDSVAELREAARASLKECGVTDITWEKDHLTGDSRPLHSDFPNGLFQAASQFNCLEFVGPSVTPERGITCYINDRTQGPACAIACAAATAFRNYFAPVARDRGTCGDRLLPEPTFSEQIPASQFGQTAEAQLNGLADVERILKEQNPQAEDCWRVKNGYIELTNTGAKFLPNLEKSFAEQPGFEKALIDAVRVGCQFDCEVTDCRIVNGQQPDVPVASQVFASACSIGYSRHPDESWLPIAKVALKGAYEATFYAYIIHNCRYYKSGRKNIHPLFLTKLGGGVFANPAPWIVEAMNFAETRVMQLFSEVRQEQELIPEDKKRPPLKFQVLVTHFRDVEPGYESFVTK